MAELIVVGNGVAGITAALAARERDSRRRITVVSGETDFFFSRTALMYAFMDRLDRRELEPFERKVWAKKKIDLARGWVTDLDAAAKTIVVDGKARGYDQLLLATGSVPNRFAAPGIDHCKDGVVHFVSMQDLEACERLTPSTRQAVVVGGGLIGIELVECLRHFGVQVTFLVREPWYWPVALGKEEAEMVTAHLRDHGVDVRLAEEVASIEADGSGRVAALTTKAGERLPCQLLGVCIGVRPAIDWLKGVKTPPALGRGIAVNAALETSLSSVWSAGDCAELTENVAKPKVEQIWYSAKRQGELVGKNLTGAGLRYTPPLFFNSSKLFEIEFTTVGQVEDAPPGSTSLYRRHRRKMISQRIVHREGRVLGFNLLGSRWDHSVLGRWIDERRDLAWVREHLAEAQFDVELGRADLAAHEERELPAPSPRVAS